MKKNSIKNLFIIITIVGSNTVFGQIDSFQIRDALTKKSASQKTLSSWDQLGLLYQIALQDVTADDKSVSFKSTLFGLHKIFDPSVNNSDKYSKLSFERHFEPFINYKYQNNFNPDNISVGFNLGIINANDATSSYLLNNGDQIFALMKITNPAITQLDQPFLQAISHLSPTEKQIVIDAREEVLSKFIITGDPNVLKDNSQLEADLKNATVTIGGKSVSLFDEIIQIEKLIDSTARLISRKWSVTFTPTYTYALNLGSVQGYEFGLNAIKGFKISQNEKNTTQLILKGSYKIGDDTIVVKSAVHRTQITDQIGFNQVLKTKSIKADDGTSADKPSIELGITGGCNWVLSGLNNEKTLQPTLQAKLGLLLGKDSWIVFPFSYNFATNKGLASISFKVNLGDSPFK